MPRTSKYFNVLTFLASRFHGWIAQVVGTERHLFLGKHIITLSPATHIKLDTAVHTMSHHFSLLPLSLLLFIHYLLHHTRSHATMTSETHQTSLITGDAAASGSKAATGAEREAASASSSSNMVIQAMVKKKVPKLYEYWKAPMIMEKDLSSYHATGWRLGGKICSITDLDFPTVDRTNIVCFESHLMCGLGVPPRIFLYLS
jgi:hypothetical protein